jgi:signal transduction histidine kinase
VAPGAGLTNIRDRLAALGGVVTIESTPGVGTRIGGIVPANGAPPAAPFGERGNGRA